jgi:hypothetical protein
VLEQSLEERVSQAMIAGRIKQEGEEIRMAEFLPDSAQGLKDVELRQESLQSLQVRIVDNERFK